MAISPAHGEPCTPPLPGSCALLSTLRPLYLIHTRLAGSPFRRVTWCKW